MTFEDDLRAVMRGRDRDAPTGLRFAPEVGVRTKLWMPLAAAVAVILLAAGLMFVVGDHTEPASGLECPDSYTVEDSDSSGWVPRAPGVAGASDRLVPDRTPRAAVVCAFTRDKEEAKGRHTVALAGSRRVRGDLSSIRDRLGRLPANTDRSPICPLYLAATDFDNYLVALRYRDGIVWVAAPGDHCAGSSNGTFESSTNLRRFALKAYKTGRAP